MKEKGEEKWWEGGGFEGVRACLVTSNSCGEDAYWLVLLLRFKKKKEEGREGGGFEGVRACLVTSNSCGEDAYWLVLLLRFKKR